MNLRSLFRVNVERSTQPKPEPTGATSGPERPIDPVDEPQPRGRAFETWSRARGWASED